MGFETRKYRVYAFTCLMLVCFGCKNDDPETSPEGTYTKEWTLDINEYLGLDGQAGRTYEAVVIDQSRILVSHNTGTTGSLVEINYADGTFIRHTSTDKDSLRLVKSSDKVLLVHEQTDTKTYTLGLYDPDNDSPINRFPTLHSEDLSPENGQLMGLAPGPPETIYTYGSMPDDGVPSLWIANWYYDGTHRWTTEVHSHILGTLDPSTVDVQVVTDNKLIFTAETENQGSKNVSLMSVKARDGYFDWLNPPSINLPIRHIVENFATGFIYAFYSMGYSKYSLEGEETFIDPLQNFANGTLTTKPLVIITSELFLAVHDGDDITLASVSHQETRWTEKYWEKTTLPLILLSAQQLDGVLVVSSNGFITKYKENK